MPVMHFKQSGGVSEQIFVPEMRDDDTCELYSDGEIVWRGTAAELLAKGGYITNQDIARWCSEHIGHCTQCGWRGEGVHACPGLPGENQF